MQVRVAKRGDMKEIRNMLTSFHAKDFCFLYMSEDDVSHNLNQFLIIEDNGIVGCGRISKWDNEVSEIGSMCIKEQYQKKGYGSKLLESLISKSETPAVVVVTTPKSVNYFEKRGFKVVASIRDILEDEKGSKVYRDNLAEFRTCSRYSTCPGILLRFNKR